MNSFSFQQHLPKVYDAFSRYEEIMQVEKYMPLDKGERMKWEYWSPPEFTDAMREVFLPIFNDELTSLIPDWKFMQGRDGNSVEWHTYTVFYLVCKDP